MAGFCENDNEPSSYMKEEKFLIRRLNFIQKDRDSVRTYAE